MTKSDSFVTKTEMSPFLPAGTIAAFAMIAPVLAFRVETRGCDCPSGQIVRKPKLSFATAVEFREYALAVEGTLQGFERTGKVRSVDPGREGPPSGAVVNRVSTKRQGV